MNDNPWRLIPPYAQSDLQTPLVDPVVFGWFGHSPAAPKGIPGALSFNSWYSQFYEKSSVGRSPVERKTVFAEWRFNHALTYAERNSLLCVHAKVKAEGLWDRVKTIYWVGATGEILFVPVVAPEALRQFLTFREYGEWWLASHKCKWGLRSRFRGAQLHFRGPSDDLERVNVHIDINNPGDPTAPGALPTGAVAELGQALQHLWRDDMHRENTHTPSQLREALNAEGIRVVAVP